MREDIFYNEERALQKAQELLEDGNLPPERLNEGLSRLVSDYRTLLKQTKKLVRIGDSNQKKLHIVKRQLEELNESLEEKVRERTAEVVEANKRLQKLDNAKNYFLGLLSHELNTPISGIDGFAKLLKKTVKSEEDREYCDMILESAHRLKKFAMISSLITKLRMEKYHLVMENVGVGALFEQPLYDLKEYIAEHNVSIRQTVFDEQAQVKIDYQLITRVVEIILENAIKYSNPGGEIVVEGGKSDNFYFLRVSDKGKGFSKQALEHIYEFFASDELMHHKAGYGLGLSAAKIIMDMHSGKIHAENNSFGGATITLHFPLIEEV